MTKNKKKSTKKRVLKWVGIAIATLLLILITAPFLFKDKIQNLLTKTINQNINATVHFNDVSLSFIKNFPYASLSIKELSIINKAPFKGDTLFYADKIYLKMSVTELFKSSAETMQIKEILTANSLANIVFDKNGAKNFDIAKKTPEATKKETDTNAAFSLGIESYQVTNLQLNYTDEASKTKMTLDKVYHSGTGNFTKNILDLNTKTTAKVSLQIGSIQYIKNIPLSLKAIIGINLKTNTYTFKKNEALVNKLPLVFNGSLALTETGQNYDISFKTPSSSFKNALTLLPEQYAKNLNDVTTKGNFQVKGVINGTLNAVKIPTFAISLSSNDGMIKYSNLPKSITNISFKANIANNTGNTDDTFVDLNSLAFTIDNNSFNATAQIKNIVKNPLVHLNAQGTINLANIAQAYPMPKDKKLAGILNANITSTFTANAIKKEQYQQIKNAGKISIHNFNYTGKEIAKPIAIKNATLLFNTKQITLNSFDAKMGSSDLHIKGTLNNFYGFLFANKELKGAFILHAGLLNVADFVTSTNTVSNKDTTDKSTTTSALKIPDFLNCTFTATANKVVYDNLNLSKVSGKLLIKNQQINLENLNFNLFGGTVKATGLVNTQNKKPSFSMNLGLANLGVSKTFSQINMLQAIAPIADVIQGTLNATLKVGGTLTNNLSPDLKSLTGDLFGQLKDSKISADKSKLISSLNSQFQFFDASKLNLNNIKTHLSFKNSQVLVKPFTIKHGDITAKIEGTHGFNQEINYKIKFNIPAKYLGKEVASTLAKLSAKDAKNIKNIPVDASLTGSFTKPNLKTNLKQATKNLVNQLIEQQKNNLMNKGKNILNNLFKKKKKN